MLCLGQVRVMLCLGQVRVMLCLEQAHSVARDFEAYRDQARGHNSAGSTRSRPEQNFNGHRTTAAASSGRPSILLGR